MGIQKNMQNLLVRLLSTKLRQKPLLESHKLLEKKNSEVTIHIKITNQRINIQKVSQLPLQTHLKAKIYIYVIIKAWSSTVKC